MTMIKYSRILPLLALSGFFEAIDAADQPKVTIIENSPATKAIGSISLASSPWCDGQPTFWLVGNNWEGVTESPYCKLVNGTWARSSKAILENQDAITASTGAPRIPRVDCVTLDVNKDGLPDIACAVDTKNDTTLGYNELYLTNSDGTLTKVYNNGMDVSGSRTLRPVSITNVKGAKGDMVFIATTGKTRKDGRSNSHQMFLNTYTSAAVKPYFKEVVGPYKRNYTASCVVASDITKNSVDDLIVGQPKGTAQMYLQKADGSWQQRTLPSNQYTFGWTSVRIRNMNRDKFDDIVVIQVVKGKYWLRVFEGKGASPFFDFTAPYYEKSLKYPAPSLEVLDYNSDGRPDIYVVQQSGTDYCKETTASKPWGSGNTPPNTYVPPADNSTDLLFRGRRPKVAGNAPYVKIDMTHKVPGCGGFVEKYSDKALILSQGDSIHAGYGAMLTWA